MALGASLHKFQEPSRPAPRCAAKRLRESFGRAARAAIFSPEVAAHLFADVAQLVERPIRIREGAPSAENLSALIRFFWSMGDRAFLYEVMGIEPLPLLAREIASEVEAVLKRKGMAA